MRCSVETPFGGLTVFAVDGAITSLRWGHSERQDRTEVLTAACAQLRAYGAGELKAFDLPLRVEGSPFQQEVCAAMAKIPFGETATYGDIAQELGASARAVGRACGANPIPIIIPCHRVLGAKGLTGYSGGAGVETKIALLRHEGAAGLLI